MCSAISSRRRARNSAAFSPRSKSMASLLKADTDVSRVLFEPMEPPVPLSVARVFDHVLTIDPDREALVTRSQRLSYAELDRLAWRAAKIGRASCRERVEGSGGGGS